MHYTIAISLYFRKIFLHYNFCNIYKCRMSHLKQEKYYKSFLYNICRISSPPPQSNFGKYMEGPQISFVLPVTWYVNQALHKILESCNKIIYLRKEQNMSFNLQFICMRNLERRINLKVADDVSYFEQ